MTTWGYRLILHDVDPRKDWHWIGLHEVYHDEAGQVTAWTENAVSFVCDADETEDGLIQSLIMALKDAQLYPMLLESVLEADRARRGVTRDGEKVVT